MKDGYIGAKELAARWNCSQQWLSSLCRQGAIAGAVMIGRRWHIPADAKKPDGFLETKTENSEKEKLPLLVGISDYMRAEQDYYYVDKTLIIKEILDTISGVTLFTRPRRFGKTLTMDMLKTFFEKQPKDTSKYFRNRKIWQCGKKYKMYQGRFPVIALNFKDVKFDNWQDTYEKLSMILQNEYIRHSEVLDCGKVNTFDRLYFQKVTSGSASKVELTDALGRLSSMLSAVYGEKVVILIDEYDTPIQQGFMQGFYEEVLSFMRMLLSAGLKDNNNLFKGILTGILRISKENLFSGLNNPTVDTVIDKKYSEYFGFTRTEVEDMARYYGREDKLAEIQQWYDGYQFGDTEIYNPWSVTNYFSNACDAQPYWANTSENSIIKELLADIDEQRAWELTALLSDGRILSELSLNIIYPRLHDNPDAVYSFLLMSGYLKAVEVVDIGYYYMALPNLEVKDIYRREILAWIGERWTNNITSSLRKALLTRNVGMLKQQLNDFMRATISWYDVSVEGFYHGMMLGLTAAVSDKYKITSNRESGTGRFDLQLEPKIKALPGIVMEFKALKGTDDKLLAEFATKALQQIKAKEYVTELDSRGISNIIGYGIAFSGKRVEIKVEEYAISSR